MQKEYSDCFYCGGVVKEQPGSREIRLGGELFIFENVPLGVCGQCGEKFIRPEVAKVIDRIIHKHKKPSKIIQVPVYTYEMEAA